MDDLHNNLGDLKKESCFSTYNSIRYRVPWHVVILWMTDRLQNFFSLFCVLFFYFWIVFVVNK